MGTGRSFVRWNGNSNCRFSSRTGSSSGPGTPGNVEEYNGSTWSEETNVNGARVRHVGSAGTQTAGF